MNNQNQNSNNSRKEEILARSRLSKNDEGVEFAHAKGLRQSWIPLVIVSLILLITARMNGMDYAFDIILNTIVASTLASFIGSPIAAYRFTKNKNHLTEAGIYLFFIIFSTVRVVSIMMGW